MKEFTNLYPVSKTLRFELQPIGKTKEIIEKNGILQRDEKRAEDYKIVKGFIDEYHKQFIKDRLWTFKLPLHSKGHLDSLEEYQALYEMSKRNDTQEAEFSEIKDNLRSIIAKRLTESGSAYERIFKKELIREDLIDFLESNEDKDIVRQFADFTTYFSGFHENRRNMYVAEEKSTAIAYRLIHQNLPKFMDNMKAFAKIAETSVAEHFTDIYEGWKEHLNVGSIEEIFRLDYFSETLTQIHIEVYNYIIGKKILEDCKFHKVKVLCPDINESENHFTVNKEGAIRFGLGGMKGFGGNIVDAITAEREERGLFKDVYDFIERMAGIVNRKAFESLVYSGAMDSFGFSRSQYFMLGRTGKEWIDELIDFGINTKNGKEDNMFSLFGDTEELKPVQPEPPMAPAEEDQLALLQKEKELVGMYLSSHPLDKYRFELETFTNCPLGSLADKVSECENKRTSAKIHVAGLITSYKQLTTKTGKPYSRTLLEDFGGSYELSLFGKDHEAFMGYLQEVHQAVYIEGEIGEKFRLKPEEIAAGKRAPFAFKVKKISLLGNITEEKLRAFVIQVTTPMLSETFRHNLVKLVKANSGPVELKMYFVDPGTGYKIEFTSKKFKVGISTEFLADLRAMGIPYTVVKK